MLVWKYFFVTLLADNVKYKFFGLTNINFIILISYETVVVHGQSFFSTHAFLKIVM